MSDLLFLAIVVASFGFLLYTFSADSKSGGNH